MTLSAKPSTESTPIGPGAVALSTLRKPNALAVAELMLAKCRDEREKASEAVTAIRYLAEKGSASKSEMAAAVNTLAEIDERIQTLKAKLAQEREVFQGIVDKALAPVLAEHFAALKATVERRGTDVDAITTFARRSGLRVPDKAALLARLLGDIARVLS
jgi:hypothetical protein